MNFSIITIFPEILDSYIKEGMVGRALKAKKIKIKAYDLRKWAIDKRKTVDDTPYGGGAGMVMKVDILHKAIKKLAPKKSKKKKVVLLSAKGKGWNQAMAKKYSKLDDIVFVCGRYEGVDERVLEFVDEEISIGDYVLTGGELGALVIIDSIARLLPGVLGNKESACDESHSQKNILEYPQYTKPSVFKFGRKKLGVPEVLLSGNHKEIERWREKNKKTMIND